MELSTGLSLLFLSLVILMFPRKKKDTINK